MGQRILSTGATEFIGRALSLNLLEAGFRAQTTSRVQVFSWDEASPFDPDVSNRILGLDFVCMR
jgi:nucleoside-diphosphate-sugar epimerase